MKAWRLAGMALLLPPAARAEAGARPVYGVTPGIVFSTRHGMGGEVSFVYLPDREGGYGLVVGRESLGDDSGTYLELEVIGVEDVHGSPLLGATFGAGPLLKRSGIAGWQATTSVWAGLPILPYFRVSNDQEAGRHTEVGVMVKVPLGDFY